jgi:hypothetical protein
VILRGWADEKAVAQYEGQLATHLDALAKIKDALVKSRDYVASTQKTYETLRVLRTELRKRLGKS